MLSETKRGQLGSFLRAHRERLGPEAVGLAPTARRRTPGLRREEVAQMAGISATWYVRIEQGRDVAASPTALDRIARALRLTPAERGHLFTLAERRDPALPSSDGSSRIDLLRAGLNRIDAPAYILDRQWDMRDWNTAAEQLFKGWLGVARHPNLLRYVFLDPGARTLIVDWGDRARRLVAECRADLVRQRDDGAISLLIGELSAGSPEFADWWDEQHVLDPEGGERRFLHPDDGELAFDQLSLLPSAAPGLRLVMLLPRSRHSDKGKEI